MKLRRTAFMASMVGGCLGMCAGALPSWVRCGVPCVLVLVAMVCDGLFAVDAAAAKVGQDSWQVMSVSRKECRVG